MNFLNPLNFQKVIDFLKWNPKQTKMSTCGIFCSSLTKALRLQKRLEQFTPFTGKMLSMKELHEDSSVVFAKAVLHEGQTAHWTTIKPREDQLNALLHEDPRTTTRGLATAMGCVHGTIENHLRSVGKVQKLGALVPHELTQANKNARVSICASLLARHQLARQKGGFSFAYFYRG